MVLVTCSVSRSTRCFTSQKGKQTAFALIDYTNLHSIESTSEIVRGSNVIKDICRQMIRVKTEELAFCTCVNQDILSIATASKAFSDEDLVNQLMTFLIAGHETTAAAMSWSLYELCRNPSIQKSIRNEIRTHTPAHHFTNNEFTGHDDDEKGKQTFQATHIDRCTYLQAFCSEILRLYPPVPLTMRVAARDTSINQVGIPKGTTIVISPWAVNVSRELWGQDAHVFRPERWVFAASASASGANKIRSSYAMLTFLGGPRSCIGQSFARAELACLVAAWVGAFETGFVGGMGSGGGCADVKVVTGISAKPGGLRVRIRGVGAI